MPGIDRLSPGAPAASASGAPHPLLAPTDAPLLRDSSPHVLDYHQFAALFGGTPRRNGLLAALGTRLEQLHGGGVVPICLLIGGGFVRPGAEPRDFDGLVVYRLRDGTDPASIIPLLRESVQGLDLRYLPGDCGPQILIKVSCFFHTLYQSRDRCGAQPSFLVTLESDS
jgi:Family of unknown function (DUF6932)